MKKEIDIFDLLPPEANKAIDKLGYDFLKSRGYNVKGVAKSYKRRARLKDAMKKRGEELRYRDVIDKEQKSIIIWFELYRDYELIARSQGIKFIQKERDDYDAEQNQERPQDLTEADT